MGVGIATPGVATSLARLGEPKLDPAELGQDGLATLLAQSIDEQRCRPVIGLVLEDPGQQASPVISTGRRRGSGPDR
jgi:hypothetical protein